MTAANGTPETFDAFLQRVNPTWHWEWPHLRYIRAQLDRVTAGEVKRLMVFCPPRHGKTEQNTVRYPIHGLLHNPALRVIIAAYNQTLAEKFSRKARRIATQTGLRLAWDRKAGHDWETVEGGGVRAVGVGTGVTGTGADLILIDDPVKSRAEANSPAYRESVWDWYKDDLYTRCEPGAAIILTLTRWHLDDLAGRILKSEDGLAWTVIRLPAFAEADDPLGRAPGEALCPERFNAVELAKTRTVLGYHSFQALYQGSPLRPEGNLIRTDRIETVDAVPRAAQRVRYWDLAATDGGGDHSASVLMARDDKGLCYIEDVTSGQWSVGERNSRMKETCERDQRRYQGEVVTWLPQDPGAAGKEVAEALVRYLAGYAVKYERVTGSKEIRAQPFAAQVEAGNVKMLKADWNEDLRSVLISFPFDQRDDEVDATSGAFAKLAEVGSLFLW